MTAYYYQGQSLVAIWESIHAYLHQENLNHGHSLRNKKRDTLPYVMTQKPQHSCLKSATFVTVAIKKIMLSFFAGRMLFIKIILSVQTVNKELCLTVSMVEVIRKESGCYIN